MPTDRNMADINTKPLRGQRIRRLMNLIAYWRSEEQTRVGERERGRERERRIQWKLESYDTCDYYDQYRWFCSNDLCNVETL